MLSAIDKTRIEAAVGQAETGTTGEIICVLSGEVSHYPEVALAWAAIVALVLPALALALGVRPLALGVGGEIWMAAQSGALEGEIAAALGIYALVQTALFILVFAIMEIPPVRRWATPTMLKRHKVERAARQQFASVSARATGSETGVLIFVALVDRQVQILADAALHQKADEAAWKAASLAIGAAMKEGRDPTAGIVQAIEICGSVLRAHFPTSGPRPQVFSDRPLEI
jgi:putative membrane protein